MEIAKYIHDFYLEAQESVGPAQNKDAESVSADPLLEARVWVWLTRHPDVHAASRCGGALVENRELFQSCSCENGDNAESNPLSSSIHTLRKPRRCLRLYTCEEQIWIAATGHGPNHDRLSRSDFTCLAIIASRRQEGILQPDLVRITGQDKRSVPTRTQRLSERGYIIKSPVVAGAARTSHLVLKRFSNSQKKSISSDRDTGEPPPLSDHQECFERPLAAQVCDAENVIRSAVAIIKQDSVTIWDNLRAKLGVLNSPHETNVLLAALGFLERNGHVKRLKGLDLSSAPERTFVRCVKLGRQIQDQDLQNFHDATNGLLSSSNQLDNGLHDNSVLDEAFQLDPQLTFGHQLAGAAQLHDFCTPDGSPLWSSDRPLVNAVYNAVSHAATGGVSQAEIKHRTTGEFFVRPLEHTISRLVDHWQFSQPFHLRYMGVIRDATQVGRTAFYVHFTSIAFQLRVQSETTSWEAVGLSNTEGQFLVADTYGFSRMSNSAFTLLSSKPCMVKCLQAAQADHHREIQERSLKRPGSSLRQGKVLKQRKSSVGNSLKWQSRGTPFWTYEEQAYAIQRPSAGVFAGQCVNLRTEGHRGRPRKSRMIIFKSDKLRFLKAISTGSNVQGSSLLPPAFQTAEPGGNGDSKKTSPISQALFVVPVHDRLESNGKSRKSGTGRSQSSKEPSYRAEPPLSGPKRVVSAARQITGKQVGAIRKIMPCVGGNRGKTPATDRTLLLQELSVADASASGKGEPWRSSKVRHPEKSDQTGNMSAGPFRHTTLESSRSGASKVACDSGLATDMLWGPSPLCHYQIGGTNGSRLACDALLPKSASGGPPIQRNHDEPKQPLLGEEPGRHSRLLSANQQGNDGVSKAQATPKYFPLQMNDSLEMDAPTSPQQRLAGDGKLVPDVRPQQPMARDGQIESTRCGRPTVRRVGPFGGSVAVARKQTILDIVEESGGVFPGDRELWYPFTTKWMEQSKGGRPDQRTVKQTKKSLVDSGKLRQVMFTFQDSRGVLSTKSILTLRSILPSDDRVVEMRSQMIAAYPDLHIPTQFEIRPDIRPSTAAQKSDRIRQSMHAENKSKRGEKFADTPADPEEPHPELSEQENAEGLHEREAYIIKRFGDIRGSEIHFMPSQDLTDDPLKDFEPDMDPRAELGYDSCYLDPRLQNLLPRESRHKFAAVKSDTRTAPKRLPRGARDICAMAGTQKALNSYRKGLERTGKMTATDSTLSDVRTRSLAKAPQWLDRPPQQAQLSSLYYPRHYQYFHSFSINPGNPDAQGDTWVGSPRLSHGNNVGGHIGSFQERSNVPGQQNASKRDTIGAAFPREKRKMPAESRRVSRRAPLSGRDQIARSTEGPGAERARPKKPRLQKPHSEIEVGPDFDSALLVAVVVARALAGGLDRSVDWAIVAKALDLVANEDFVSRRWRLIREKSKKVTEKTTRDFQASFLKEYGAGRMCLPDFEDLAHFDWKGFHAWASKELLPRQSKKAVFGFNRKTMEKASSIKQSPGHGWPDVRESKTGASIFDRRVLLHQKPIISALPTLHQRLSEQEQHAALKTCIKSIVVTPKGLLDKKKARSKLTSFEPVDIDKAIQDLLSEKVISPTIEERSHRAYSISEHFVSRLVSSVQLADLDNGTRRTKAFDQSLRRTRPAHLNLTAGDGSMLAVVNLIALRMSNTEQQNLPKKRFGLTKGGYRTRTINKSVLNFEVGLVPTASSTTGYPMASLPGLPSCKRPGHAEASAEVPCWRDANGNDVQAMWRLIVSAVLNILIARPGMPQKCVLECLKPAVEAFEIQAIMKWLVGSQAAIWVGRHDRAIRMKGWWWMVLEEA